MNTELEKIWAVELDLLKVFLEYCEKHGVKDVNELVGGLIL